MDIDYKKIALQIGITVAVLYIVAHVDTLRTGVLGLPALSS